LGLKANKKPGGSGHRAFLCLKIEFAETWHGHHHKYAKNEELEPGSYRPIFGHENQT